MRRLFSSVVLGTLAAVTLAGSASAFDNTRAGIALHIAGANPVPGTYCGLPGIKANLIRDTDPTLSPGFFYFTYLLVCNGSDSTGVAGAECGIQFPDPQVQIYNWILCADLEFPSTGWPASGGGNLMTWDADNNCQNLSTEGTRYTVIGVLGYFYNGTYAPAQMFVTPRPVSGRAKVADCSAREDDITAAFPSHLGAAGWGGASGYNPCGAPTPVENTTWGKIKTQYNR